MEQRPRYDRTIMVKTWHADETFSTFSYGRWKLCTSPEGEVWIERVGGKHAGKIMYVYGPVIDEEYGEIIGFNCYNYRDMKF